MCSSDLEQMIKTSTPGIQQVRRFYGSDGHAICDMIYDEMESPQGHNEVVFGGDFVKTQRFPSNHPCEDLLVPVMRDGQSVYSAPSIHAIRERTLAQLSRFPSSMQRFDNPQPYPCGLERSLYNLKSRMIQQEQEKLSTQANKKT